VNNLEANNTDLQNQVNSLQSEIYSPDITYQNYTTTHSHSNSEYNALQLEYDNYVAAHHHSDLECDEARYSFHYVKPTVEKQIDK